jgi:hypothetical protein
MIVATILLSSILIYLVNLPIERPNLDGLGVSVAPQIR